MVLTTMSFERQHESLLSTLKVNKEENNLSYNEEITSRGNEEIEKLQRVENDVETFEASKDLLQRRKKSQLLQN